MAVGIFEKGTILYEINVPGTIWKNLRWTHLPRPDGQPDAPATWWATRWLPGTRWTTRFSMWPKCENLVVQSGCLEQSGRQMKLASVHIYLIGPDIWPKGSSSFQNLVAQEPSGHPLGRQSIWLPIRSPEHLVVNLVVVDAFSINNPIIRCNKLDNDLFWFWHVNMNGGAILCQRERRRWL